MCIDSLSVYKYTFNSVHLCSCLSVCCSNGHLALIGVICTKYDGFDVCHRMGPYTIFMLLRKFSRAMNNQNQQIWREECVTMRNVIQRPGHNLKESLARQQFNLLSSRVGDPRRFGYEHARDSCSWSCRVRSESMPAVVQKYNSWSVHAGPLAAVSDVLLWR